MAPSRKRWLVGAAVALLFIALVFFIRSVLVPLLLSFILAYILDPFVDFLARRRVPRSVSALLLMILAAAVLVLILIVLLPTVFQEARAVAADMPEYSRSFMNFVQPYLQRIDKIYPGGMQALADRAIETAKANIPKIVEHTAAVVGTTFSSVVNFIIGLLNVILIPVMTYFLLNDLPGIRETLKELIPHRYRVPVTETVKEIDRVLSAFVRGQLTVCTILAFLYGIGLSLLGVPMALFWALLGGYGNLIPYVGTISSATGAMLMTLLHYHDLKRTLLAGAVFAIAQTLEGTVIGPRIVGKSVGLNPVVVIVAVIVGGNLFGFLGMLLAVPFVAAAIVLIKRGYREYLQSGFYRAQPAGPPPPANPA